MTSDTAKSKALVSAALMGLWVAMLLWQADIFLTAIDSPPPGSGVGLLVHLAILVLLLPGLLIVGIVGLVFRDAFVSAHAVVVEQQGMVIVLLFSAAVYTLLTYPACMRIRSRAEKTSHGRALFWTIGSSALLGNGLLAAWMIWARVPYYAHPAPGLSAASLVVGVLTFCSFLGITRLQETSNPPSPDCR